MNRRKILLISTGGTIGGEVSKFKKEGENIILADQFAEILKSTIISIKQVHAIETIINHEPLKNNDGSECNLDSSDIIPAHWIALANLIQKEYDNFDAFLVTHGTNTLGYTCSALSFSLANIGKPIIFTGSQVPAGMPGSDAFINLENALRLAAIESFNSIDGSNYKLMGIFAVFGSHIISGTRVKKDTEFDYDAFKSFGTADLGRIGRIIDFNKQSLLVHNEYLRTGQCRIARNSRDLIVENEFDTRIISFTEFPGMNPDYFKTLVDRHDVKGFILRAFGAGDASRHLLPAFKFLKNREIPIVITTQAPNGNSNFQVNEPGAYLQKNDLGIPSHDMSIESITTKLAWLLAKKERGEIHYDQLKHLMVTNLHGEINVIWEVKI